MNHRLSDQELLARIPLWEALSEFWLDTELADFEFDHIARVIAASPYSLEEVRAIHDYEVAPVVAGNLMCVAGAWSGFDSAWLDERCRHFAERRHSRWFRAKIRLQRPFLAGFTKRYWQQVLPRVLVLREASSGALSDN